MCSRSTLEYCIPLAIASLLLSQQLTNLAAVFGQCCIAPSRYGSYLSLVMLSNSHWVYVISGKFVSLISWYRGQVVGKCSSCFQHIVCAVGVTVFSLLEGCVNGVLYLS